LDRSLGEDRGPRARPRGGSDRRRRRPVLGHPRPGEGRLRDEGRAGLQGLARRGQAAARGAINFAARHVLRSLPRLLPALLAAAALAAALAAGLAAARRPAPAEAPPRP